MFIPERVHATEEMLSALSAARANVALASAMLAYQMFKCDIFYTDDERFQTAAALVGVDKNYIFLDKTFFLKGLKDTKERAFVLLHEVKHIFLAHGDRAKEMGYHRTLWNIATDYNINLSTAGYALVDGREVVNDRFTRYVSVPENCLFDKKYLGMSSDQIYNDLLKEYDQSKSDGESVGEWCERTLGASLDEVQIGEGDTSAQQKKNLQTAIASIEHAKMSTGEEGIGANEMDLIKRFQDAAKPKIKWTDRISYSVTTAVHETPTYNRLSRRSTDVCFPTYHGSLVKVFYGVDSSGSMSDSDYKRALGELQGILDQYNGWEIDVYTCDTASHLIGEFVSEDGDIDLSTLDIKGGGGTEMKVLVEKCNELVETGEKEYDIGIIVTDGYLSSSDDVESDVPVIFVVTENGNKNLTMTNNEVIHIER